MAARGWKNTTTKRFVLLCFRSNSKVTVHFVNRDGEKITVKGSPGDSLLDVVINEDLDFDGFGMETRMDVWFHTLSTELICHHCVLQEHVRERWPAPPAI